jgi:hypothetical protein
MSSNTVRAIVLWYGASIIITCHLMTGGYMCISNTGGLRISVSQNAVAGAEIFSNGYNYLRKGLMVYFPVNFF